MPHPNLPAQLEAERWKPRSLPGFIGTVGPLWTRREDEGWAYGMLFGPQHLNPAGVVHGGALATLIDHVISTVAWEASERKPCLTLQLDTHFMGPVREGDFAQARATITHRTPGLLFMQGSVTLEQRPVLTASAILKVVFAPRG